jgi:hypothetical protein
VKSVVDLFWLRLAALCLGISESAMAPRWVKRSEPSQTRSNRVKPGQSWSNQISSPPASVVDQNPQLAAPACPAKALWRRRKRSEGGSAFRIPQSKDHPRYFHLISVVFTWYQLFSLPAL